MRKTSFRTLFAGLCFALLVPLSAFADVTIDEEHFPDANFRNWLLEQYFGQDGIITDDEIAWIRNIDVSKSYNTPTYEKISTLEGIQYFTALTTLNCSYNQLTSLDVSKNTALTELRCYSNQLTSLDVSKNTELTTLDCSSNQQTELDVTKNTALTYLDCGYNQLTELDVSKNTALTYLYCYNNQLTSLDVTNNTALYDLTCSSNQLTTLDVSQNTALTQLWCYGNQLTNLNVANNTALRELRCSDNQLTALDVSKNTALTTLWCNNNQLTELDVTQNTTLTSLECYNNQIYGEEMDKLIKSLREYDGITSTWDGVIRIINNYLDTEGNICTWNQADAIMAKGWNVYNYGTKYDGLTEWNVEMHEGQGEYWATLYAPFGYTLPADAEAYVGTLNDDKQTLKMTSIGQKVPRGVPVVIKGNSASVVAEVDDRITAEVGDHDLIGKYEPFDATGTDVYTLGIYEDIVGFYKYKGTTERFKAVLELPEGIAANGYRMVFEDDDITAIEDASAIVDNANAVYYDLQGRRVAEPQRGQLYIVNGKTIVYQP